MIDLERFNSDIATIEETISSELLSIKNPAEWSRKAGISRQMLQSVMTGKSDFSLKKKIDIYRRLRDSE